MKKAVIPAMLLLLSTTAHSQEPPTPFHKTVEYVDMTRFSGDWYVIALNPNYILELNNDYSYTVIGTNNYKYLWFMSREPSLDAPILNQIIERIVKRGFDRDKILMMTQTKGAL